MVICPTKEIGVYVAKSEGGECASFYAEPSISVGTLATVYSGSIL